MTVSKFEQLPEPILWDILYMIDRKNIHKLKRINRNFCRFIQTATLGVTFDTKGYIGTLDPDFQTDPKFKEGSDYPMFHSYYCHCGSKLCRDYCCDGKNMG